MYMKIGELYKLSESAGIPRVAVVNPYDPETLMLILELVWQGKIEADLIGETGRISKLVKQLSPNTQYQTEKMALHSSESPAIFACDLLQRQKASILLKGDIHTGDFLKAVIKTGLVKAQRLLTHVAVYEIPNRKLIFITDPSVCIQPDTEQQIKIVSNAVELLHQVGYSNPKVAILSSVEYEEPRIPSSMPDRRLLQLFRHGGAVIEGPLGLDNAVSAEAAAKKHLTGQIRGDADILLVPNMDCGNLLCKGLRYLGSLNCGNLILGASVPIVFTSRSANYIERLNSLRLACAVQNKQQEVKE